MTREEAMDITSDLINGYNQEEYPENYSPYKLINQIFDYFESRTCENCIHISTKCDIFKNNYKYILETRGLEISKNKFTCGLWESKE